MEKYGIVPDGAVKVIDGERIPVYSKQIALACLVDVTAGTNGFRGGDSGHGCRTYIRVADAGGTDVIRAAVNSGKASNGALELVLGGDDELRAVIKTCEYIARILKLQVADGKVKA